MEMDDFRQRKLLREQQKQERLRQQRRLTIKLLIALAVLIGVAITIFTMAKDRVPEATPPEGTSSIPETQSTETQQTNPTEQTKPEEDQDQTVITFAAAGDLNITDNVVASGGENYDYTKTFMDVLPLLGQADLTAINIEGNFVGPPYGSQYASAPTELLSALWNIGVDLVQVANSYTIKNGVSGMISTIQTIRGAGFETMGAYLNQGDFNETGGYTIRKVKGVKVAVVAFTKGMDSMILPAGAESCVNLLYQDYATAYQKVDTDGITAILRAVAKEKPDITIAMVHWGSEYNDTHSKSQENIRKLLIEEGVDAIIGTHPHYVQEIVFDEAAGTLVAYSLGDFISNGTKSGTEYSIVLELEITKDHKTGKTVISGYHYTPIFTVSDEETLRVVRLKEAMADYEGKYLGRVSKETYNDMDYAMDRIADRVVKDEETDAKK